MFNFHRAVFASFATLSATATFAQAQPPAANPSDASAAVPAVEYLSTFTHYRHALDQDSSADSAWYDANAEVGKPSGHADHMRSDDAASNQHQHHGGGH